MSGNSSFSDLCVLIVDDNDHMRRLLRSILKSLDIQHIRDVENGMIALNESRVNLPDVIITDMMMTPVDGLEFTRLLREDVSHPATHVPIMMVTGYSEKQHVEAARDAGVTEFLAKPVTVERVEARLRSVIENPRRFIRSQSFVGPDRRRRSLPVPEDDDRRGEGAPDTASGLRPVATPAPDSKPDVSRNAEMETAAYEGGRSEERLKSQLR